MTSTPDTWKTTNNDWLQLLLALFFVVSGTIDVARGAELLKPVSYFAGAAALLSFYGAPRLKSRPLRWFGWAAFAVFLVLSVIDLFGLAA